MPNYRRAFVPGGTYFFTVAIAERRTALLIERIDALSDAFRVVRAWRPFGMLAFVVLPDHLHCIWSLPEDDADFPARWNRIKGEFSRRVDSRGCGSPSRISKRERGIWQRRYWEHLIRDERDLRNHIDYIHFNPVKHRYVLQVRDWPHSSFRRFVREGVLPIDWNWETTDKMG
jgi:putative transposase